MRADLFCQVIDHYGDIGVTWRLAKQLSAEHNISIRLWVDDLTVFARIEPRIHVHAAQQTIDRIDIRHWVADDTATEPYPIVITSFCCPLSDSWTQRMATPSHQCWVELEYLSAESWVESHHGLSSQRADGLAPTFFYPGFTERTAGLIRERHLIQERDVWQADSVQQRFFLENIGVRFNAEDTQPFLISLFAYPHAPYQSFLNALGSLNKVNHQPFHVLVPEGVSLPDNVITPSNVTWQRIPFLTQPDYDRLLWSMNLNVVRGEDSFTRALWAGKPMLWHIYHQSENTHLTKLAAWLAQTTLPQPAQNAMMAWSTQHHTRQLETALNTALQAPHWAVWQQQSTEYAQKLAFLPDLANNLAYFCLHKT
jgi:uncharacterized repeat protein (TIGR03837 family)